MPGSTEEYSVSGFVYGYDNIRLEFDIAFKMPAGLDVKDKEQAAKDRVDLILPDLKFCYPMPCVHCGLPATTNMLGLCSWSHLPPRGTPWRGKPSSGPYSSAYIHAVCSMSGACGDFVQLQQDTTGAMMRLTGTPSREVATTDWRTDGTEKFPRNGACANCQTDESVHGKLSKCGKCKTTLYCRPECQLDDWERHRQTCKWIKGVRFVDPNGKIAVWKENLNPNPYI